ncbi:MAG: glycoside hydrolase family 18 protein [Chloroflexia bacterium]
MRISWWLSSSVHPSQAQDPSSAAGPRPSSVVPETGVGPSHDTGHPVARLSRTARFSVMEPANGGYRGKRGSWVRALLALAALLIVLGFDYPFSVPSGSEFDNSDNGVWIEARWSDSQVPSEERQDMVRKLASHGVRWIYADEGELRADGSLPGVNSMYAGALAEDVRIARPLSPTISTRLLAWISGRNHNGGGNLRLGDPAVRQRIVGACKYFVEQLGFDGVHLDIEPAPSGDPDYLQLLDEVRNGIGAKTISVAAMKWTPIAPSLDNVSFLPYSWERGYYREVALRVDQVVLMDYDTAIPVANLYIKYAGWQTSEVLDAVRDFQQCKVLIGVPTYSDERWNFHPSAENLGSGLQGVIEALRDLRGRGVFPQNFAGVALFASSTTTPDEWATFDKVWRGK